jgi:hypothetical protein
MSMVEAMVSHKSRRNRQHALSNHISAMDNYSPQNNCDDRAYHNCKFGSRRLATSALAVACHADLFFFFCVCDFRSFHSKQHLLLPQIFSFVSPVGSGGNVPVNNVVSTCANCVLGGN